MSVFTSGRELWVGPNEQYTTLHAAIADSQNGDTIFVRAGIYENDFSIIGHNLSIIGVDGMAHLHASASPDNGKGILVTNANTLIENLEFSGSNVRDQNGAGIRQQFGDLTVRNSYFHDNENGILSNSDATTSILIENSHFENNGNGTNLTHHVYVNNIDSLTVTESTFDAVQDVTHIQSRAQSTTVTNSTFDDTGGTASFLIRLANAGEGLISGNTLINSETPGNTKLVNYGGASMLYPGSLLVDGNTFVNNYDARPVYGVQNLTDHEAVVSNNTFIQISEAALGPVAVFSNTFEEADIVGTLSADMLAGGDAGETIDGLAGGDELHGGDGADILMGRDGNDVIFGDSGADTLLGGVGNDTLDGGVGIDRFVIGADDGNDIIQNFVPGTGIGDLIDLVAHDEIADFAALLALAFDDGNDTTIAFANGDSLLLSGVLKSDLSDDDFLFASSVTPPSTPELLSDSFNDGDFSGWSVIDQTTKLGPSAWSVSGGEVVQSSNILEGPSGFEDHRLGTVLLWDDASAQSWQDYTADVTFRSTDNDGIGLVFYYTDENNYYKVDFDKQQSFSKLFQVEGGVETELASVSGAGYVQGADTALSVSVSAAGITVLRDGAELFGGPVSGGVLSGGTVGLYSWGNTGAHFDDVVVTGSGPAPDSMAIAAADAVKPEGDAGVTDFTFTVTRTGDTTASTSVDYQVTGSGTSPADAADFDTGSFPLSGQVSFAAGEASQTVTVQVVGDTDVEADETFTVTLSNAANGELITTASATGTIENDDTVSGVILSDDFNDGDFSGWSVVDQTTKLGPSAWSVSGGEVVQSSNILEGPSGFQDHRLGTVLLWDDASAQSWQDYTADVTFRSTDNDGIGLVFYYTDEDNYYKVDFDKQQSFSKLFQVEGGVETELASASGAGYVQGAATALSVSVSAAGITVLRDGADVFGGPVSGGVLSGGTVGLYSWGNTGAHFDDVVVTGSGPAPDSMAIAADRIVATGGDDRFVFVDNDGSHSIEGFAVGARGNDVIDFSGVAALNDFDSVLSAAIDVGQDSVIGYTGGSLELIGVQTAEFHADDFIF